MNKKHIRSTFVALLLAVLGSVAWAGPDSADARAAAADRYLRTVPMSKMLDDTFAEISKQLPAERRQQFLRDIRSVVQADALERIARDSMVQVFTADELNALADFYGSPDGASAMQKFGVYMGQVMPAIQQEVQAAIRRLQLQRQGQAEPR